MDKNSITCPWGDCPGLDHGPKSKEHEGRFINQSRVEHQMADPSSATAINGNSTRNSVK